MTLMARFCPIPERTTARFGLEAAAEAFELLEAIDAPVQARELVLVEAPLRFSVAQAHPGLVVVSDRYYRIWPAKRFRKFHRRQLVRAVFGNIFAAEIARRGSEKARDIAVAGDLIASYLGDLYVLRRYKKSELLDDILQPVSFIPIIDQLLYDPQTPFADVYFSSVLDREPLRDDPRRFMHARPRGRLYYEKLRDLMTPSALRLTVRAMMLDGVDHRTASERAYGSPLDWFFRQWSLPRTAVDYRLAGVSSRRLEGGSYQHAIAVERRSVAPHTPISEPVSVRVELADGSHRTLTWDGRGRAWPRRILGHRRDRARRDRPGRPIDRGQATGPNRSPAAEQSQRAAIALCVPERRSRSQRHRSGALFCRPIFRCGECTICAIRWGFRRSPAPRRRSAPVCGTAAASDPE